MYDQDPTFLKLSRRRHCVEPAIKARARESGAEGWFPTISRVPPRCERFFVIRWTDKRSPESTIVPQFGSGLSVPEVPAENLLPRGKKVILPSGRPVWRAR